MRKRAVALLLVLALVACAAIGLAACNEGGKDGGGAGKRIFTESASLDDVIAALENAESFTLEQKVNYSAVCQTGIIRNRFSAADSRLNRVIRLANTVKY